jgi:putative lipoprotein
MKRRLPRCGAMMMSGVVMFAPKAFASEADPWFGQDKALHFGASAFVAIYSYGLSSIWVERRWVRAAIGGGAALAAGSGKELYDLSGHGTPSWRDFTWDVAGAVVGVGVALALDYVWSRKANASSPSAGGMGAAVAFSF